jgi:hypothetical protein
MGFYSLHESDPLHQLAIHFYILFSTGRCDFHDPLSTQLTDRFAHQYIQMNSPRPLHHRYYQDMVFQPTRQDLALDKSHVMVEHLCPEFHLPSRGAVLLVFVLSIAD